MSTFAIVLVIFSALLHASWNIIGKSKQGSGGAFFLASSFAPTLLLLPFTLWFLTYPEVSLPVEFWLWVMISAAFQALYILGLAYAYQRADVGVIYPIARALPVLMVGVGTAILGQVLSLSQWIGFGLITLGCLCVPLVSFRQFKLADYMNAGVAWALVAAIGTTGYSILDKVAIDIVSHSVAGIHNAQQVAIFYLGVQFGFMAMTLSLVFAVRKKWDVFVAGWAMKKSATVAGIMMGVTYTLVLYAMTLTENVSLVVALRQTSIIFGLLLGIVFLKEKWLYTRGVGVICIVAGLVLALTN
ncbi:putative Phosphonate utilization associated transmembrane protein [Vibrio nigripulchritudo SFn27]|uniref:Putative Phosphonate utilization associated transmembrane protein n=1 Tax=Vibrio nigripulchritudo TaxID=28173 RepID=U4KB67_9VIBR|nr:EamA family transporter [Vibrio nigripulchritudo]CCN80577.1 putative Phosphonate utilization associated transmembrane protein [Vibrio nigripulchritudo BLFn1]CCN90611.1 putative Phosphonate utilization associated transmembrane protein [Vibrio nigripulchritudo SFn27]CCN93452.1 putative Phosphonate utilization associated transmembrane protein [Vibrio nigripulchritudo ENn2]CCO41884.1 putative Phosphonate utilization associated transmembrane protein [Vibrio nigripulchritudo SFn135]CCO52005.1 put